jgi:hypothetical protein
MTKSDTAALEALISSYCAAWGELDAARRGRLVQQVWAESGTYTDPSVHLTGSQELVEYIGRVLKKYPGAWIERTSAVDAHHGMVRFTWRLVWADGETLIEGVDFGELSGEGKLSRIVGFSG